MNTETPHKRNIGYARVSKEEQNTDGQLLALQRVPCDVIFQDKISGAKANRPELLKMLGDLQPGDTVVVYKIDRLSRSVKDLLNLIEAFKRRGVFFRSLLESIDTNTDMGKFFLTTMGAVAELERNSIITRTRQGLAAAKARGIKLGADPKWPQAHVMKEYEKGKLAGQSMADIARGLDINRATLYRYLERIKADEERKAKSTPATPTR